MVKPSKHRGVIVPMATPFTSNGSLDEPAAERLVAHLATNDMGVFVLGTTGEAASIPTAARARLVEIAVKTAAGRVSVYAGVTDNCLSSSIESGRNWLRLGVDAVVAPLPSYYLLSPSEMQLCYELLAREIKGALVLYNIPQTTRMSLPLEVVQRLSDIPNIVGFKDSENVPGRLEKTAELFARRPDFAIFMGASVLSAQALRHGFDGLVPSSGNIAPALWRDLFNASLDGKWEQVEELQRRLDAIARVFHRDRSLCQSLAALKACLEALGLCGPAVLPPIQTLDADARLIIQQELAALDLVPVPVPVR
jgi:dihydrodipicolinate synthase/N-acetylneuraminate lyase